MWGQGQGKQLTKGRDEPMERRWSKEKSGKLGWEEITCLAVSQVHTPKNRKQSGTMCDTKAHVPEVQRVKPTGRWAFILIMMLLWAHADCTRACHWQCDDSQAGMWEPHKACIYANCCSSHNSKGIHPPWTNQEEIKPHVRCCLNYSDNFAQIKSDHMPRQQKSCALKIQFNWEAEKKYSKEET